MILILRKPAHFATIISRIIPVEQAITPQSLRPPSSRHKSPTIYIVLIVISNSPPICLPAQPDLSSCLPCLPPRPLLLPSPPFHEHPYRLAQSVPRYTIPASISENSPPCSHLHSLMPNPQTPRAFSRRDQRDKHQARRARSSSSGRSLQSVVSVLSQKIITAHT